MTLILPASASTVRPPEPEPTFVVRVRKRTGFERMDPRKPQSAVFEIGWTTRTDPREWRAPTKQEFGQMVGVNLSSGQHLLAAMHAAADLWAREVKRQPSLLRGRAPTDRIVARFTVGRAVGRVQVEAGRIADEVHRLADRWERERRDAQIAWLAEAPAQGNS